MKNYPLLTLMGPVLSEGIRWLALSMVLLASAIATGAEPIIIGLDADMSSGSAQAGEAIRRGALIAISEINERGGLLGGRHLELQVKDHRGFPTRSTDNLLEFAATKDLAAVLAGFTALPSSRIIN